MHSEYSISFITINYNGLDDTCALIDSLPRADGIDIVVVDNASRRDEASAIAARYPYVTVVRSDSNLGFAGGNNLGISAAKGQYLFFINNDTIFHEGTDAEKLSALGSLCHRLVAQPQTAAVCPKIRFAWGEFPIQYAGCTALSPVTLRNRSIGFGEPDAGQYDSPSPTPYVHGAAMLVRRDAIERAGLMPECFFLYYEELDWSMMFRRAGYDLWYDPVLTVFHKESQSTGQNSPLRTYYVSRNRLLFARRNIQMPRRLLTYLYLLLPVTLRDIFRNLVHGQTRQVRAVAIAIADFLRGKQGMRSPETL